MDHANSSNNPLLGFVYGHLPSKLREQYLKLRDEIIKTPHFCPDELAQKVIEAIKHPNDLSLSIEQSTALQNITQLCTQYTIAGDRGHFFSELEQLNSKLNASVVYWLNFIPNTETDKFLIASTTKITTLLKEYEVKRQIKAIPSQLQLLQLRKTPENEVKLIIERPKPSNDLINELKARHAKMLAKFLEAEALKKIQDEEQVKKEKEKLTLDEESTKQSDCTNSSDEAEVSESNPKTLIPPLSKEKREMLDLQTHLLTQLSKIRQQNQTLNKEESTHSNTNHKKRRGRSDKRK